MIDLRDCGRLSKELSGPTVEDMAERKPAESLRRVRATGSLAAEQEAEMKQLANAAQPDGVEKL